jgi:serine/threonine-protein kinase
MGLVARGGMGEVWLARQMAGSGRTVIIKRMLDGVDTDETRATQMLLDEARISSQLNHSNIVRLLDLGRDAGSVFIVMEHLHGENLSVTMRMARKRRERVPKACALAIGAQIARALAYAHAKTDRDGRALQLVHRDVTPRNIIITYDGVAKLIDFGIAKAVGRSATTGEGLVKGSLGYMSPEQARGENVDGRSDVFSLGVVMFELLTDLRFHPLHLDDLALFRLLAGGGPFPAANETVPQPLASIVDRALAPLRDDRWPDAAAFGAELEAALAGEEGADPEALSGWLRALFADGPAPALPGPASRATPAKPAESIVDADEWFSNMPALDRDGRLVGPVPAVAERVSPTDPQAPLELDVPAPAPSGERAEPTPTRAHPVRIGRWVALGVAIAVAAGAFALWKKLPLIGAGAPPTLLISSSPWGATVRINGAPVGLTPYAADNRWHGRTPVELQLQGYQLYETTFEGGAAVELRATLRRR